MRRHWPLFPAVLSLLFALTPPSHGDASPPPQGALYLGGGQMLEAAAPRQLSLNAHVTQFAYQPLGLEIAYVGSEQDSDQVTDTVRLTGVRRGKTTTLISTTHHVFTADSSVEAGIPYAMSLEGWSADGRYLLVRQDRFAPTPGTDGIHNADQFLRVDVGAEPMRVSSIPLPDVLPTLDMPNAQLIYWWSPGRRQILFAAQGTTHPYTKNGRFSDLFAEVYDPAQDKRIPITVGDEQVARGWLDDTHLLLDDSRLPREVRPDDAAHYASYDVVHGTQTTITKPVKMPASLEDFDLPRSVSPKAPALILDVEKKTIPDRQGVTRVEASAIWVRRTLGPKPMSAMPVGLAPGPEDPQAQWSPSGKQVAFVAHGDLFVTDLNDRDAETVEKYRAGEKLTCTEERDVAASSIRQIGLAILQFVQDNDENWPTPEEQRNKLAPYLPPDALLSVGGHPFVYHVPPDLALAKMASPSETVLGTIDLPCATVTLYADGHVKSLPKQGITADGANN